MPIRTELNTQLTASYSMAGSTIEDIDFALYEYINEELDIFTETNEGFKKVPVLFSVPGQLIIGYIISRSFRKENYL